MSFAFGFGTPKLPPEGSKPSDRKGKCPLKKEDLVKRQLDSLIKLS